MAIGEKSAGVREPAGESRLAVRVVIRYAALWTGRVIVASIWFVALFWYQLWVVSWAIANTFTILNLGEAGGQVLYVGVGSLYGVIALFASHRVMRRFGVPGHFVALASMVAVLFVFWDNDLLFDWPGMAWWPLVGAAAYWLGARRLAGGEPGSDSQCTAVGQR